MHVGVGVDPLNGMLHQVLVMDSCGSAKVCRTGHVFVAAAVASAGTGYFSGCIRASLINVASWLDVGIGFTDRPGEISLPLRNWRVVVCRLIPDRGRHTYQSDSRATRLIYTLGVRTRYCLAGFGSLPRR